MIQEQRATPAACVVAVDDHAGFRAVLRDVVEATNRLVVVGEADCGESAVELVSELRPDLVLMDVRMPGIGGIAATKLIKELRPSTLVVLVSTTPPDSLESAAGGVADELVSKNDLRPSILDSIWERRRAAHSA